ncbi:SMP-30/gluconolactonase/LRE family protein [Sinorhizobium medicae]|uniref:Gluconolaconase n=2 Tax=Sinorhizobium medicae TaxID=110321 RepID=A0A508X4G5_9HYPH|nr:SMP-30/gluconolactonase/LRE family protein [Sinorhizobium medicae]ABR62143.1 SMP-30/Gluconolaconase/LRE domain protein [Sinorhizobium medicae WSM419]MBO1964227.1 SMP-30/gluconolactonase/LRE family protein [Sinorhizobium medicae]MDX0405974.1 SMP-30/gluconolactonase/LRE family protein [Sinorhizobium medicae]MDX0411535.1 SMP-30/gluconolactonase/LRE family protein [Sinorhizobium medicae]MDX0418220.1 SMP-30/gluconolactonase/LRE family protein [Sinorhizobium medicae]
MSFDLTFECLLDARCHVAESPVFDERRNCLFFVDIGRSTLHRVELSGAGHVEWTLEGGACSIGLAQSGRLVLAQRDRVVLFDPAKGAITTEIAAIEPDRPDTRLNDGKVGPDGAFWVGTMHDVADRRPVASLYRVTRDGTVERKVEEIVCSNGLAWSGDGSLLFHSDSRGPWINRWRFDPSTGALSACRRLVDLDEASGRPDGAATDAEGSYWSAGVSASVINRFSPEGRLIQAHRFPVPAPTMPCFAGPDLKTLVVTSLRPAATGEECRSGGIFAAQSPVAGVAVRRFDDRGL